MCILYYIKINECLTIYLENCYLHHITIVLFVSYLTKYLGKEKVFEMQVSSRKNRIILNHA